MATPEELRRQRMQEQYNQPVYGPRNPPPEPAVAPGYSDDLTTRRVQAYRDAQQQRAAVAGVPLVSPGYTPGLAGLQAAEDARMQRQAVGPQVAQGYAAEPAVRNAQAADDAARQQQFAQPVETAVDAGLGPQGRPALQRGLAAATTPPTFGGAGQRGVASVAALAPVAATPPQSLAAASRERVQQPLVSSTPTAPAQPAMDPQLAAAFAERDRRRANNAVLEQDRANLAGLVGTRATPEQALSPQTLEATNQRIQAALDANRAPAQTPGEHGNYNLANTSNVDAQGNITTRLRQPDNIVEGGYGQFGGGRAAQFLASRQVTPTGRGLSDASEEVRLRTALTSNNPQERRAAREQLASRQALALDAGATQRTGMQLEGEQLRASLAGQAAVQAAQARAAGQQQAAQIQGQYGLQEAQARAQGTVGAAQVAAGSGSSALSQVRAEQIARQLAVAQAAEEAGDLAGRDRALGISQGTAGRVQTDALGNPIAISTPTGVRPLTPEEIAAIQQASAQYNVRPTQ